MSAPAHERRVENMRALHLQGLAHRGAIATGFDTDARIAKGIFITSVVPALARTINGAESPPTPGHSAFKGMALSAAAGNGLPRGMQIDEKGQHPGQPRAQHLHRPSA